MSIPPHALGLLLLLSLCLHLTLVPLVLIHALVCPAVVVLFYKNKARGRGTPGSSGKVSLDKAGPPEAAGVPPGGSLTMDAEVRNISGAACTS